MASILDLYRIEGATRDDAISGMQPQFRMALEQMFQAAPPEIQKNLRINSGYRSVDVQKRLWENALRKYGSPAAARKWVAPPGNSQHNHGHASDLKYLSPEANAWAHANAAKYGLAFPLSNEDWHIELAGARGQRKDVGLAALVSGKHQHTAEPAAAQPAATAPTATADLFAQPAAQPMADPLAGQMQPVPVDNSLGSLAMLFAAQQQDRRKREEEAQQAEQMRKAALFGTTTGPSVYG